MPFYWEATLKLVVGSFGSRDRAGRGAVVSPMTPIWLPESVGIRGYSPGVGIRRIVPPRIGGGALECSASRGKQVGFITRDQRVHIVDFSHFAYI
jgi:hypothetical protein